MRRSPSSKDRGQPQYRSGAKGYRTRTYLRSSQVKTEHPASSQESLLAINNHLKKTPFSNSNIKEKEAHFTMI